MRETIFKPGDILLPKNADMNRFCVVACDQYTSEPAYWETVREYVGGVPSSLHCIFPEADFKTADFDQKIHSINEAMNQYLKEKIFDTFDDAFIYIERTLRNGAVRRGLMGCVDLEAYDYRKGAQSPIRATEGTVLDRIPPRVKIRENAPLELPHIMLLIDDRSRSVIEPLSDERKQFQKLYDFDLMQESGHLSGWLLHKEAKKRVLSALEQLADPAAFSERYDIDGYPVLQYAVGDGNHSLATAKKCYTDLKEKLGEAALSHPARYALVELVNLHDESLEFEAIHRVVFDVSPEHLRAALAKAYALSDCDTPGAQKIHIVKGDDTQTVFLQNPSKNLAVGSLQDFIDAYIKENGGEVDYIHGEQVVREISARPDAIGFLLEPMEKNDLFKTVVLDGALPRKTFSMGEACDKRFYCEARRIR